MKQIFLLALVFFLVLVGCTPSLETAKVTQVIDGDTITIEGGYRVRYIGIDAPEIGSPFGIEALRLNSALVAGKTVSLERDVSQTDSYGRLLRYVYVGDVLVNAELVRQGLAVAKAYPPDTKYQDYLRKMETEARLARRGIWATK